MSSSRQFSIMSLHGGQKYYHEVCANYLSYSAISSIVSGKGSCYCYSLMCNRQLKLCPKLTCDQCHEKEYHMPYFIMPQHKFSDADGYPNRKVRNNRIRKIRSINKMYEFET